MIGDRVYAKQTPDSIKELLNGIIISEPCDKSSGARL